MGMVCSTEVQVTNGPFMPARIGEANINECESHQEVSVVNPKGSIIHTY